MILNIVLPFVLAIFFAYLITPAVEHFEKKSIKRSLSIVFVYVILLLIIIAASVIVLPEFLTNMSDLVYSVPQIASLYREKVDLFLDYVLKINFPDGAKVVIHDEVLKTIQNAELLAIAKIKNIIMDSIGFIPCLFRLLISLIITFYIIKDSDVFKKMVFSFTPAKYRNDITIAGREMNGILKNFIQGQILTAVIIASIESVFLMMVGVKFPFILGIIGGLANIIPYFGPIIGAVPAILVGLSQSGSIAMKCILVFVVIQQVDNAFISPKIIEEKIHVKAK